MISKNDIIMQNISDMGTVIKVLSELIKPEMLDEEELKRLHYCTKIAKQVKKKQLLLNSKK